MGRKKEVSLEYCSSIVKKLSVYSAVQVRIVPTFRELKIRLSLIIFS